MKDFIKDRTWEDWLIYCIGAIILIGLVLFSIGFWWSWTWETGLGGGLSSMTTNVKSEVKNFDGNLFKFISTISSERTTLYAMAMLSIVGFSFIMLGLSSIVCLIIFAMTYEWLWPHIKKYSKKEIKH